MFIEGPLGNIINISLSTDQPLESITPLIKLKCRGFTENIEFQVQHLFVALCF
uniref:Uncharacterized protein n=1 Tax=Lepeophtheirus salmonis TaxID=72036 RepID=A0A0K2VAT4_LEPSM